MLQEHHVRPAPPALSRARLQVPPSANSEGRFKREAFATACSGGDLREHDPARLDGRLFRCERRQAAGNQISIDEVGTSRLLRQELPCECRLPRAVGPGDDDDLFARSFTPFCSHALSALYCLQTIQRPSGRVDLPRLRPVGSVEEPASNCGSHEMLHWLFCGPSFRRDTPRDCRTPRAPTMVRRRATTRHDNLALFAGPSTDPTEDVAIESSRLRPFTASRAALVVSRPPRRLGGAGIRAGTLFPPVFQRDW